MDGLGHPTLGRGPGSPHGRSRALQGRGCGLRTAFNRRWSGRFNGRCDSFHPSIPGADLSAENQICRLQYPWVVGMRPRRLPLLASRGGRQVIMVCHPGPSRQGAHLPQSRVKPESQGRPRSPAQTPRAGRQATPGSHDSFSVHASNQMRLPPTVHCGSYAIRASARQWRETA